MSTDKHLDECSEPVFKAPKRVTSWRTCPKCGSRATKLFHLNTGRYHCQICDHEYRFERKPRDSH